MENKLNIQEGSTELNIAYKWYTVKAIFFIVFSFIWFCFLGFWYSMAGSGNAPLIFFLFPIVHVTVGFFILYLAICMFVNTTYIKLTKYELSISHKPLPWWGAKTVDVQNIKQFFVRQKEHRNKKGHVTYSYNLIGLLIDNSEVKILASQFLDMESDQVKRIEHSLENFLGIQDFKVDSEYQAVDKKQENEVARRQKTVYDPTQISLKDLQTNFIFEHDRQTYKVVYQVQYDWSLGNTDRLLQVDGSEGSSRLLLLQKKMAKLTPWWLKQLQNYELDTKSFVENDFPNTLNYEARDYRQNQYMTGKMFDNHTENEIEGVTYLSPDERFMIFIIKANNSLSAYLAEREKDYTFENILPQ